jgi:hypothetical protein
MAVNDTFRVILEQTLHNQKVVSVLHYRETATAPVNAEGATGLAARVAAIIVPALKGIQSVELVHDRVVVQHFHPPPVNVPVLNATAAGPGGVAGDSLPTEVTAVITKTTPYAGPKYRGRMYVAGVPVSSENNSQLSAAALIAWNAAAAAMMVTLTSPAGDDWDMIVWHKATSTFDYVSSLMARPVLRSQRRRQIGKGV